MEFEAFILCGKGSNLSPLSATRDTGIPKPLLPLVNVPMIQYVVDWCEQAQFKKVTIVAESEVSQKIQSAISNPAKVGVMSFDCEHTGEILKQIVGQINSDFVLLPCDFLTDLPPQVLIESFRNKEAGHVAMSVYYRNQVENIDKKHLPSKYTVFTDKLVLDTYTHEDVLKSKYLEIRNHMLWRHANSSVSRKLIEAGIYFCSQKAIPILQSMNLNKPASKVFRDLARRSWRHHAPLEELGIFILPDVAPFIRANSLTAYMEANRSVLEIKNQGIQSAPGIGADSQIGKDTVVGEKSSVKKSALGNNVTIGKNCRINGSILLDGVVLEDNVHLENTIVGLNACIESKSRLTNCYVEGTYRVSRGSAVKGETLSHLFLGSDIEDSEESDSDESEYSDYDDDDDEEDDGLFDR